MKKRFLIKTVTVFFVFIFSFLLQWKITFGKSVCKINMQKIMVKKCFSSTAETHSAAYEIYPFEDFLIKI